MRYFLVAFAILCFTPNCRAQESSALSQKIASYATRDGVPKDLVERVILRESRFNPRLHTRSFWGLMQLRPATARGLGYHGRPEGLLDPDVNLKYGVLYLANAWRVAGENAARAVRLYASGYYYEAKRKGRLALVKTLASVGAPLNLTSRTSAHEFASER